MLLIEDDRGLFFKGDYFLQDVTNGFACAALLLCFLDYCRDYRRVFYCMFFLRNTEPLSAFG